MEKKNWGEQMGKDCGNRSTGHEMRWGKEGRKWQGSRTGVKAYRWVLGVRDREKMEWEARATGSVKVGSTLWGEMRKCSYSLIFWPFFNKKKILLLLVLHSTVSFTETQWVWDSKTDTEQKSEVIFIQTHQSSDQKQRANKERKGGAHQV